MSETLEVVRYGRVLRLSLNRPDKRNALSAELCHALVDALEAAGDDPETGAILLTANGKAFCAGMDLSELRDSNADAISDIHERLFTIGSRLTKPLIAAVNGAALGGGTGLVANCHIVVASPEATFGLTEIRLGLWPFLVYRAVLAAVGERRTLELALTGRIFDGKQALAFDLAHELSSDPEARALEVAQSVAAFSPTAVQSGLQFVKLTKGRSWEEAGAIGRRFRDEIFRTEDFQEGLQAFRDKRNPRWPSQK